MGIHNDLWTQNALYLRNYKESESEECGEAHFLKKDNEFRSGRPHHIWIYNHIEPKTHFIWENTRDLGGLV